MKQEDKQHHYERAEQLLAEQNFTAAIIAGAVATGLAAVLYSLVVTRWSFSYGFAVAGIGVVVGLPMQFVGRGIENRFAVAAAILTIAGCILGNVLNVNSPAEILQFDTYLQFFKHWNSFISGVDLVFWFVAVFAAVFLARRPLSRSDRLAFGTYNLKH